MTYDQWKTTDPREYDVVEEDQPELDLVSEELRQAKLDAESAAEIAAKRIAELETSLQECLEFFEDRSDVRDGSDGEPIPNKEMQLAIAVDETLYGIRF
jgi:hypothetical protein